MRDLFALFNLKQGIQIDKQELEKSYQELQRLHHPNRHARNPQAQALAAQQSSFIQDAYQKLINPATRLKCLLELTVDDIPQPKALDSDFLLAMMELREQHESNSPATTLEEIKNQINSLLHDAQFLWPLSGKQDTQALVNITEKLRFLCNMQQQIKHG